MRRSTPKVAGRSKYNVRTDAVGKANRTVDNILFDSLKEAKRYQDLKLLQRAMQIFNLVAVKTDLTLHFPLVVNGLRIATYKADFRYDDKDGNDVVEDTKGFRTPEYRLKKKLVKALYNLEIKEI